MILLDIPKKEFEVITTRNTKDITFLSFLMSSFAGLKMLKKKSTIHENLIDQEYLSVKTIKMVTNLLLL